MGEFRIALAGNPNTGKSTLFNALTGLRQHTGNWPGKTVVQAVGTYEHRNQEYQVIDLPGTYSLYSNSSDEEVARDYILFEQPDVTVVVLDATSMERNLNLALQVLEMTDRVVIAVNLIDEAKKKRIDINEHQLTHQLGVPVVKISARDKVNLKQLLDVIESIATGRIKTKPYQVQYEEEIERKISGLEQEIKESLGNRYPSRWIALRILDGDVQFIQSLQHHLNGRGTVQLTHVKEGKPDGLSCH